MTFTQEGERWQCPNCGTHLVGPRDGACPICADRARGVLKTRLDATTEKRADREWEMAGLARQDGDLAAERTHTERARAILRGDA